MTATPPAGTPTPSSVIVPVPADAAERADLTARLGTLTGLRHPHLLAPVEVRTVRDGALDVVYARGEAADLPAVLAVRGRLTPGESAAVGIHIAQALAALHAAGLVHGPLEPADVVLRPGGAPALRPRATVPPHEWTSAEDVRTVARLIGAVLGSPPVPRGQAGALAADPVTDPDGALRRSLEGALGADPRRRPEAGTLAALIDAACEPTPVRLPDPATLAGAALAGVLRSRGPEAGARTRATRRVRGTPTSTARGGATAGRRAMAGSAGRRTVAGSAGQHAAAALGQFGAAGSLRAGSSRTARRRRPGWGRGGVRPPALRPALVVAGVALAIGAMTGAALELRDPAPGTRDRSQTEAAGVTASAMSAPAATSAASAAAPSASSSAEPSVSPSAAPSAAPPGASRVSPDATLDRDRPGEAAAVLTQRRLDVLSAQSPDLGAVDAVGSPAHDADTALLAQLRESGTRPERPHATVTATDVVAAGKDTATVRLEYVLDAHDQIGQDGTRVAVPASGGQTATLDLRWTDDGWRVTSVA